jgi:hypothetical protein
MKTTLIYIFIIVAILSYPAAVLAGPSSDNYQLKDYTFGAGGTKGSTSDSYSLNGTTGQVAGQGSSNTYSLQGGLMFTQGTNTIPAPTLGNGSDTYYNKLSLSFSSSGNPSDSQFLIAISTDNFGADNRYVQTDHTIANSKQWQTYTNWNNGSFNILGLSPGTTYYVKIATTQGSFTQSPFSASSSKATVNPSLTFDIDVAPVDTESSPPFTVSIGDLIATTVITAPNKVWVDIDTNGTGGGLVYINGSNGGLLSTAVAKTIPSTTTNLATASEGYGARSNTVTQSSGGPLQAVSPYNGASDNVGVLDTTKRLIFDSNNQPVTSGRGSLLLKAKASAVTEAATDYTDTLTLIATAGF